MTQQYLDSLHVPGRQIVETEEYALDDSAHIDDTTARVSADIDWTVAYADHFEMIVSRIMAKNRTREYAEDIAGETFVKAITANAAGCFRPAAVSKGINIGGWLYKIALRLNFDGARKEAKLPTVSGDAPVSEDSTETLLSGYVKAGERQVLDDIMNRESSESLARMIAELFGRGTTEKQQQMGQRYARILLLEAQGFQRDTIIRALDLRDKSGELISGPSFEKSRQGAHAAAREILARMGQESAPALTTDQVTELRATLRAALKSARKQAA